MDLQTAQTSRRKSHEDRDRYKNGGHGGVGYDDSCQHLQCRRHRLHQPCDPGRRPGPGQLRRHRYLPAGRRHQGNRRHHPFGDHLEYHHPVRRRHRVASERSHRRHRRRFDRHRQPAEERRHRPLEHLRQFENLRCLPDRPRHLRQPQHHPRLCRLRLWHHCSALGSAARVKSISALKSHPQSLGLQNRGLFL